MKKIIKQISIILLIMIIGTTFSALNKAYAAAGINCVGSIDKGKDFTVSLKNVPAGCTIYSYSVQVKYSDGTTSEVQKILYDETKSGSIPKVTFNAKVGGTATITMSNIVITNHNGDIFEGADGNKTFTQNIVINVPCTHENKKTEVVQNLSCTKDKIEVIKCSSCNKELERKTTEKAKGHTWGEQKTIKAATCCENGSAEKVCTASGCGAKETITLKATGNHTYTGDCKKQKPSNNTASVANKTNTTNSTNTAKDNEEQMPKFKDVDEKVYAKKACNVRSSCSTKTNNNKIGSLEEGEQLTRTGVSTEWSRVLYNGEVAYVATSLLTTEEPEDPTNEVANEVTNEVDDELADIQKQVGVLPEVGNNVAVSVYFVITAIAVAAVSGSLYYINKK